MPTTYLNSETINLNDENLTDAELVDIISQKPDRIIEIDDPSEIVQLAVVMYDGELIRHIENPTKTAELAAVRRTPLALKYIPEPEDDVIFETVRSHQLGISHVNSPSLEAQLISVQTYPHRINLIDNPAEFLQFVAIQKMSSSISSIKHPTPAVQRRVIKIGDGHLINQINNISKDCLIEEIKINHAIARNIPSTIKYPKKFQLRAVEANPQVIDYFPVMSAAVQRLALEKNPLLLTGSNKRKFTSVRVQRDFAHVGLAGNMGILDD